MEVKIVTISDSHKQHRKLKIEKCDILLFTGDMSRRGEKDTIRDFFLWLNELITDGIVGKIVFIAGNHDTCFDPKFDEQTLANEWLADLMKEYNIGTSENPQTITYLENSSVEIDGIKIWGSPITPWFFGDHWAFNKQRGEDIKTIWDTIPEKTDIILTHGPAQYILDYSSHGGMHTGCQDLAKKIEDIKPMLHVCGHIHESWGMVMKNGTTYINSSVCNEEYQITNPPFVL